MRVRITAHIKEIDKDGVANVACNIQQEMSHFASEDLDDAMEFLTGEEDD